MAQSCRHAKWIVREAWAALRRERITGGTMLDQTGWVVLGAAVVVAALLGFVVGRTSGGSRGRVSELESEVARQKDELSGYKREVEAHFDKTAALFVSMAGSYKELVEHLSASYHKLGEDGSRELFRDRVNSLLVAEATDGGARDMEVAAEPVPEPTAEAAEVEAVATPGGEVAGPAESTGEAQAAVEQVPTGEPAVADAVENDATPAEADTAQADSARKDG